MAVDEIIKQIQSRGLELSREQILEKLEDKKRRTGGLVSDEVLLRIIASESGVEIKHNEVLTPLMLSLRDLVPGLNNVTLIGRIIAIFPPKTFEGARSGKFASLFITDRSGVLRVVLWNDNAGLVESGCLRTGQIIRFAHGYTREDRTGHVELHIGEKSTVEIAPGDVDPHDYPTIKKFATKIENLTEDCRNKRVNIIGAVKELFPASTFERRDLTSGKVMRFVLADETDAISVVMWNEKVDEIEQTLREGSELQIVNGKVKKAVGKDLEIHIDSATYLEMLPFKEKFFKIADLREGIAKVNVKAEIATKPLLRDVKTSREEIVKLANFELKDETGRIWVSAWRNQVDSVKNLKVGDKIIIKNVYIKKGFGNQLELSTRNTTSININDYAN
jgi:ssDNA-binding replication factor A large subunit